MWFNFENSQGENEESSTFARARARAGLVLTTVTWQGKGGGPCYICFTSSNIKNSKIVNLYDKTDAIKNPWVQKI